MRASTITFWPPLKSRPPKPEKPNMWDKLGYKCTCNAGFYGLGVGDRGCKPIMKGCDRYAEKCGKNSTCHNTDEKPFYRCLCDAGFTGSPPDSLCKEEMESLSVGAGPGGVDTCEQQGVNFDKFRLMRSTLKAELKIYQKLV